MKQYGKHTQLGIACVLFSIGAAAQSPTTVVTNTFHISGNCEMCKERIEHAALSLTPTIQANWNIKTGELIVEFDSALISGTAIQQKIAEAGHDNESFKASEEVYKSLPSCCHYNRSGKGEAGNTLYRISGVIVEETLKGKIPVFFSFSLPFPLL